MDARAADHPGNSLLVESTPTDEDGHTRLRVVESGQCDKARHRRPVLRR